MNFSQAAFAKNESPKEKNEWLIQKNESPIHFKRIGVPQKRIAEAKK